MVSEMFAQLLAGQSKIAQDIADMRKSIDARFEAIEKRIVDLEQQAPSFSAAHYDNLQSQIQKMSSTISTLSSQNDDLENRSRRNNLILYGLTESEHDTNESLQLQVRAFFTDVLKLDFPQIERLHRLGRLRGGRPRPVIMKLLDFREKISALKNGYKLKGSQWRISEDFSSNIRSIRKKLWDATAPFRNNGSVVHLRYDHAFVDNQLYNWDVVSNSLVKARDGATHHHLLLSQGNNP